MGRSLQTVVRYYVCNPDFFLADSLPRPKPISDKIQKFALENTKRKIGLDGPRGEHWMMHDMNTQLGVWARSVPLHCEQS